MPSKQQLEAGADAILLSAEQAPDPKTQFCIIWSGTIKPILDLAKILTGPKIDDAIDQLSKAADKVCDGTNPDVANYCNIWKSFKIKEVLQLVKRLTGPKVDKVIDKFISISDSLCP